MKIDFFFVRLEMISTLQTFISNTCSLRVVSLNKLVLLNFKIMNFKGKKNFIIIWRKMSHELKRGEKRKLSSIEHVQEDQEFFYVYDVKRQHLWSNLKESNVTVENVSGLGNSFYRTDKVRKLFDICLRFVAVHVEWVESFERFPSLVAHQIFNECVSIGRFNMEYANDQQTINQILRLFAHAYPGELATSLNLKNNYKLLKSMSQSIGCFCLTQVDLSNCDLNVYGSGINFIDLFEKSLDSLEVLNLSDNSLDNEFLAKFTLPHRLNLKTFPKLATIDLSRNRKLTSACLSYFLKYPKLNEIILSFEEGTLGSVAKNNTKYQLCQCVKAEIKKIENIGWIKPIVKEKRIEEETKGKSFSGEIR
jgi:hypothetical protein